MADSLTQDIIAHSVTEEDVMAYGGKGVINFVMPYWWATPRIFALPTDLPPYWSYQRDVILRNTILYENFWGQAVAIAINKVASQSFDVKGDVPKRVSDLQELIVQWGGEGYVPGTSKMMGDFFCSDNGAFVEVVRQSSAAGSKIIGLLHLDSLRCQRTGDPDTPILFRDLKGGLHELRDYQVLSFTDMPDPGYSWLGVGHCAAERAYDQIYKIAGMTRTLNEKITGAGAHQMAFISGGVSPKQVGQLLETARNEANANGLIYYLGTIIAALQGDNAVDIKTLQLRGLPENFDPKEMLDEALLAYANALGLVLTDLQPLAHQGLGSGKQSETIEEKAQGRTIATFRKMFTHAINEWIAPDATTFFFKERDLRDETQQAGVALIREQVRDLMIQNGEVTAQEARQLAVDADDLPHNFETQASDEQILGDEERASAIEAPANIEPMAAPVPQKPAQEGTQPAQPVQPQSKEAGEVAALWALKESIDAARKELQAGNDDQRKAIFARLAEEGGGVSDTSDSAGHKIIGSHKLKRGDVFFASDYAPATRYLRKTSGGHVVTVHGGKNTGEEFFIPDKSLYGKNVKLANESELRRKESEAISHDR